MFGNTLRRRGMRRKMAHDADIVVVEAGSAGCSRLEKADGFGRNGDNTLEGVFRGGCIFYARAGVGRLVEPPLSPRCLAKRYP